jgi:hypothetical protein
MAPPAPFEAHAIVVASNVISAVWLKFALVESVSGGGLAVACPEYPVLGAIDTPATALPFQLLVPVTRIWLAVLGTCAL